MNVLLINPPRTHEITGNNPRIIEKHRGCNPPLGLLYIAAYLEKHSRHDVHVIDAQVENLNYQELERRIRSVAPEVVGITAMTMTLLDVLKTASVVKGIDRTSKIVIGGPHVHLYPLETIGFANVDFLVLGEGEKTFCRLLENIGDIRALKELSGIVFKAEEQIIQTGHGQSIEDLDELPFPARHLVPYQRYTSLLSNNKTVTTIFTSRGCPYRCSFCDRPHLGKRFRARSPKNVVDELSDCVRKGVTQFLFYDDTFTLNKKRAVEICEEINRRQLRISWDIRTRVDKVDSELIAALRKAGCVGIHFGVESGSQMILNTLKKGITLQQVRDAFRLTRTAGIRTLAYFMVGNPGENVGEVHETLNLMKSLNPDFVHVTIFTPFPGTVIYREGIATNVIAKDYWKNFATDPTPDFVPPHWPENFTRRELEQWVTAIYRKFYLRPAYFVQRLSQLRSVHELRKNVMAGLSVVSLKKPRSPRMSNAPKPLKDDM